MRCNAALSPGVRAGGLISLVATLQLGGVVAQGAVSHLATEPAALQGCISSDAEGTMEGVLVRARKAGSPVTVSVISDAQGKYRFPISRMPAGKYRLSIRAPGFALAAEPELDVAAGKPLQHDLALLKTAVDPTHLTNAEWLMSLEKAGAKKEVLEKLDCVACHSLTRVLMSKHDPTSWPFVLSRMKTYGVGGQKLPYDPFARAPYVVDKELVQFLSAHNLNGREKHSYEYVTLPRPRGRATRVVITEYEVPGATFQPHEVLVDPEGQIWATDFAGPTLLKLDPNTAKFTEYKMPYIKPGFPHGQNCFEMDAAGDLWWIGLKQAGVFKFDRRTEQFTTWKLPTGDSQYSHAGCLILSPDGTVWAQEMALPEIQRLDPRTGKYTHYDPFPKNKTVIPAKNPVPQGYGSLGGTGLGGGYSELGEGSATPRHSLYGSAIDSKGTFYIADIGAGHIVKIDPETKAVTLYQTPTVSSGPRKMQMDKKDRLWFAEYHAGKVGMLDTNSWEFKEWPLDSPYAGPYDVMLDRNGYAWTGGMHTDYLYRLNTHTGEVVKYLLPTVEINMRNMGGVDNSTNPVTVWLGENHQRKIARVETLD